MRSFSVSILWVVAVVAVLASCGPEGLKPHAPSSVMTQDLGIGADLDAVLAASTADVPALVDAMWAEKDQSSFAVRADAIAAGIARYGPDLVGLQSVIQWRRQAPASASPADEVVSDYLELLLAALAARGLTYDPVALTTTADIELTGASGNDYRLVDREVILAAKDMNVASATGGTYAAQRSIDVGGTTVVHRRGWAAVVAERDGKAFHFISTALEAHAPDIARFQAAELAALAGDATLIVGNLGADPQLPSSPGYGILLGPGARFLDMAGSAGATFWTCCRDVVCIDPAARLDRRADFVLGTTPFASSWGSWVNGDVAMSGGLWPSSHAGIVTGAFLLE